MRISHGRGSVRGSTVQCNIWSGSCWFTHIGSVGRGVRARLFLISRSSSPSATPAAAAQRRRPRSATPATAAPICDPCDDGLDLICSLPLTFPLLILVSIHELKHQFSFQERKSNGMFFNFCDLSRFFFCFCFHYPIVSIISTLVTQLMP